MKNTSGPADVEAYLARIPEPARTALNRIRAAIRSAAPAEATEYISYGMPAFHYRGPLIAYAAHTEHCAIYPMYPPLIVELKDELRRYETSKGAIRFPTAKPIAGALLKKIVKARVAHNEAKKRR